MTFISNNKIQDFYTINKLPPYVFSEVNRLKAQAKEQGRDIIDFSMGNPDAPTPNHIIEKLIESVHNPKNHGYSVSNGIASLRKAQSNYYTRRFGVDLDPDSEIVATLGSKEGFSSMVKAITKPRDVALVPSPSYPMHTFGFIIAEVSVRTVETNHLTQNDLAQQIKKEIENCSPNKPVCIVLNYPCNPTTNMVSLDFYEEIVTLCKYYGVYILSDLAYCEIYFNNRPPPSILQIKGAKDIAVEFTSISKTYSMAGWRIGFVCGNKKLISAISRLKSYLDYGSFTPIQIAATAALNGPDDCIIKSRDRYKNRRDALVRGLQSVGWNITPPQATMFAWVEIPKKYQELGSLEFSKLLLRKANMATTPGIGFGKAGDNFIRMSLIENEQRIEQAVQNVRCLF